MNRRGFALLLALAAIVILGAVAATGVILAAREAALGRGALAEVRARSAAEAALAEAARGWTRNTTPIGAGDSATLFEITLPGAARARVLLRSLGSSILALEATGETVGPTDTVLARSRVELLVRLDSAGPDSLVRPRPIPRGWRLIP